MRYTKVENHPHLVKDAHNNAVVNTNAEGYRAAKLRKNRYKENQELKKDMFVMQQRMHALEKYILNH